MKAGVRVVRRRSVMKVAAWVAAVLVVHAVGAPPAVARGTVLRTVFGILALSDMFCLPGGTCLGAGRRVRAPAQS